MPQRGVVTLATNVPGPREQLKMLGHKVIQMYPIPPIALQLRIGIGMLSYGDEFTFGIVADYDSAPDIDVLTDGIEQATSYLPTFSDDTAWSATTRPATGSTTVPITSSTLP